MKALPWQVFIEERIDEQITLKTSDHEHGGRLNPPAASKALSKLFKIDSLEVSFRGGGVRFASRFALTILQGRPGNFSAGLDYLKI
jgi:hypothetical protein